MINEFEKKSSELLSSDEEFNFLGIEHAVQFHIRAGVSSLASTMAFPNKVSEDFLGQLPDYIHSETLEKELDLTVSFLASSLVHTKYFPNKTKSWVLFGELPEGSKHNVCIEDWEDYQILNFEGNPLYTREILSEADAIGESPLATVLWLIVKDICDDGRMLSEDWYRARILLEYFREYPIDPDNAFLIGKLYKELCVKQTY